MATRKNRTKESTTVYFEAGTLARLRAVQQSSHVPTAVRIRAAVEEWLTRYEGLSSPVASSSAEGAAKPPAERPAPTPQWTGAAADSRQPSTGRAHPQRLSTLGSCSTG